MDGKEFVRMENISMDFPGVKALDNVSIQFNSGEIHALVGENGAGKSTLIKILTGVYQKKSGEIYVDGEKANINDPISAKKLGLSAVYQDVTLAPHLTVAENFFLGNIPKTKLGIVKWRYMYETTQKALNDLNIKVNSRLIVKELSVAQQEMVVIAKKYFDKSKLIVFDEPTALLANAEVNELFKIIRKLKDEGKAIIYISHRMEEITGICDIITVLKDGKKIDTMPVCKVTENDLVTKMVGREIKDMYSIEHSKSGDVVLEVKNLTKKGIFEDISFTLHKGEILGFFGLVGSGRTDILRAVFGADSFDSGEVYINGEKRNIKNPIDAINLGIGFLPEDRKTQGLTLHTSINENINLASYRNISKAGILNIKEERKNAIEYVERLKVVTPSIRQKVINLSGGNQQKVVLSKWLCKHSNIFIFDEPTVGIDVGAKTEIYKLFEKLLKEGNAVIMISSYLPEIMGIADRIITIYKGKNTGILQMSEYNDTELLKRASGIK